MKNTALLFVLCLSLNVWAQKKKLYGSWQSDSTMVVGVGDSIIYTETHNKPFVITFNKTIGNICEVASDTSLNKSPFEENKVKYKHKKVVLKNRKYVINSNSIDNRSDLMDCFDNKLFLSYKINSDSSLTIRQKNRFSEYEELIEGDCYYEYKLKRMNKQNYQSVSEMIKEKDKVLQEVFERKLVLKKQDTCIYNSLKVGGELKISVEGKDVCTSNREVVNYYVDAIGMPKNDSTIMVHSTRIQSSFYGNDGYTYTKDKYDGGYNLNSKMLEINKSNVTSIRYYSPKQYKINQNSNTVAWLAFVSAIVVAPMASINFKEKSFNRNRYFKVLGVSSGIMAVSITITLNTNSKSYFLGSRYGNGGWDIE